MVAFDNFSMTDSKVPANEPTPHPLPVPETSTYIAGLVLLVPLGIEAIRRLTKRTKGDFLNS